MERREGRISTGVYRKDTHTDRYINYSSHHHPRTKTGVITCLRNRADNVCDHHHKQSEMVHLKITFRANGYPITLINKTLQKQKPNQTTTNRDTNRNTDQERPKVLYLPYVKHTSELIQRACRRLGIRVVFKSHGTLHRTLMRVKNARPELKMKEVVYEVPCKDCECSYIGKTRRNKSA